MNCPRCKENTEDIVDSVRDKPYLCRNVKCDVITFHSDGSLRQIKEVVDEYGFWKYHPRGVKFV